MVRSGLKRCRNRFPNRLKFGSGSRNVTWSESGNRNGLMSGSDTRCAVCHFLTCRFWHVPVLACQFWTPTGFYTVLKRFHASFGTPPGFYTVFKPFDASLWHQLSKQATMWGSYIMAFGMPFPDTKQCRTDSPTVYCSSSCWVDSMSRGQEGYSSRGVISKGRVSLTAFRLGRLGENRQGLCFIRFLSQNVEHQEFSIILGIDGRPRARACTCQYQRGHAISWECH